MKWSAHSVCVAWLIGACMLTCCLCGCGRESRQGSRWHVAEVLCSPNGERIAAKASLNYERWTRQRLDILDISSANVVVNRGPQTPLVIHPSEWHPDSRRLLFWVAPERNAIYVFDIEKDTMRPITESGAVSRPLWSPGANEIVYVDAVKNGSEDGLAGAIVARPASGGEAETIAEARHLLAVRPIAGGSYNVFYVDPIDVSGSDYETGSCLREVWVVDRDGERPTQIVSRSMGVTGAISVSPDGVRLALLRVRDEDEGVEELLIHSWQTAEEPRVVRVADDIARTLWSPDGSNLLCLGRETLWLVSQPELSVRQIDFGDWRLREGIGAADWMADGEAVVPGVEDRVVVVNTASGEAREIHSFGENEGAD